MGVKWIEKVEESGSAILFPNYLMTNKEFKNKFDGKYSALTGLDDENDLIILKPLTLDEDLDAKYQNSLKLKINMQRSYIRFGNTKAVSLIASLIHVDVPKSGLKGVSHWDDKLEALVVDLGGKK